MDIEVRPVANAEERGAAGAVAGRALSDNPTSRWVYGDDPLVRVGASLDLFVGFVNGMPDPQLAAFLGEHVVGIAAVAPPGGCIGHVATDDMRVQPAEIGPPGDPSRLQSELALYVGHDPDERHWHVGPVSVDPVLQSCGIGARLMEAVNQRLDAEGEVAWLETDKPGNVVFYRRAGYEVVEEVVHHGVEVWFMRRLPR
jgi:GNAT superfamily N-acetyltransferase